MEPDNRTAELIAIGASVTASCQPCLQYHVNKAFEGGCSRCSRCKAFKLRGEN